MTLKAGDTSPDFTATAWDGEQYTLSALRGHKVWLGFFRYASCPLCNMRVHHMIERYDALSDAGLRILTVFQSPAESVARYVGKQTPPFPILCDPGEELYALYGLQKSLAGFLAPSNTVGLAKAAKMGYTPGKMEGTKTRIPGDFLIDPQGQIVDVFHGKNISEHIPFERIEQFLA